MSRLRAERAEPVHRLLAGIEHDELMFCRNQAAGHGKAHLAKADESNIHDRVPYALLSSAKHSRAIIVRPMGVSFFDWCGQLTGGLQPSHAFVLCVFPGRGYRRRTDASVPPLW